MSQFDQSQRNQTEIESDQEESADSINGAIKRNFVKNAQQLIKQEHKSDNKHKSNADQRQSTDLSKTTNDKSADQPDEQKNEAKNRGQQPISEGMRKWMEKLIDFIDKLNTKDCFKLDENDQIPYSEEFTELKKELTKKLSNSKAKVKRNDLLAFFDTFSPYLDELVERMAKKLRTMHVYNSKYRLTKAIRKEIESPKKQKQVAEFEQICSNGKKITSTIIGQQQISEETRKWVKKTIEFIAKLMAKDCFKLDENDQLPYSTERAKINGLAKKLRNSKEKVTRYDLLVFFDTLSTYLDELLDKMPKKLREMEAYRSEFRFNKALEKEMESPKKQKQIAKLENIFCPKHFKNIGNELDNSMVALIHDSFQKLLFFSFLATDKKQKEYCEHFNIYYYKQKGKVCCLLGVPFYLTHLAIGCAVYVPIELACYASSYIGCASINCAKKAMIKRKLKKNEKHLKDITPQ
ncbi:hypothetical protein niasHT_012083 [Heterodera trifolii]|uniref:Uncharacterized protein n=1 Tax=Heterodera trifolii TaxID=157864 RepID=A0ABD2LAE0_9BILA